jgi:hypothetical protein
MGCVSRGEEMEAEKELKRKKKSNLQRYKKKRAAAKKRWSFFHNININHKEPQRWNKGKG